jgi:hypothetical protein
VASRSYTLVADGRGDAVLCPIIDWLLLQNSQDQWRSQFAYEGLPALADGLQRRAEAACALFPCDALIIHRDAEGKALTDRRAEVLSIEIRQALVPVVPVRMTEAWLFASESAIRLAAEHPNGEDALPIPNVAQLEQRADIKEALLDCLDVASGLNGRQLDRFKRRRMQARFRITELTDDFSPLRQLAAFQQLEADLVAALANL